MGNLIAYTQGLGELAGASHGAFANLQKMRGPGAAQGAEGEAAAHDMAGLYDFLRVSQSVCHRLGMTMPAKL